MYFSGRLPPEAASSEDRECAIEVSDATDMLATCGLDIAISFFLHAEVCPFPSLSEPNETGMEDDRTGAVVLRAQWSKASGPMVSREELFGCQCGRARVISQDVPARDDTIDLRPARTACETRGRYWVNISGVGSRRNWRCGTGVFWGTR